MELYEIIHEQIFSRFDGEYTSKSTIITATMDKNMAEKMLKIYRANCGVDEAYNIRTVREPEIKEFK